MGQNVRNLRVGITDDPRSKVSLDHYQRWILQTQKAVEVVRLSHHLKNSAILRDLDGLLLTGGGDVHPGLYGKSDQIGRAREVDESRDAFEFEVIEHALDLEMPVLGICRGMQIMNVYLGGTLEIDLVSAGFRNHAKQNGIDNQHPLLTKPDTLLGAVCGPGPHTVNSSHHQAVDRLGKGLKVAATSDDGVIESLEWILKDRTAFLLLVQWHPERIADFENPCSGRIAEQFLKEVSLYSSNRLEHPQSEKETEYLNHG